MKSLTFSYAHVFAPKDLKKVLGAMRVSYEILGSPRNFQETRVRITTEKEHAKGVFTICRRLFGWEEEVVRRRA